MRQRIDEVVEQSVDTFATDEAEGWDLDQVCQAMNTLYGSDVSADELREDFSGSFDRQALVDDFFSGRPGGVHREGAPACSSYSASSSAT